MTRTYTCDIPKCDKPRERWMRMCSSCWPQVSRDLRNQILLARREKRMNDYRRLLKEARAEIDAKAEARRGQDRWDNPAMMRN